MKPQTALKSSSSSQSPSPLPSARTAQPARAVKPGKATNAAGEVRIIGGQWKRSLLPVANKPGLRPTPNRVRETLFNWLGQDMTGLRCIDAFAGTGALGFEAASRGALDVVLVEGDAGLIAQLTKSKDKLKAAAVRIQRGDGIAVLQSQSKGSVDVIFIDPPFDAPIYEKAIAAAALAVTAQGAIYLEAPKLWTNEDLLPYGLQLQRSGKAGAVHFHLTGPIV